MSVIGRTRTTTGVLETIVQELSALQIVNSSTATIWHSIPLEEGYDIVLDVKATGKSTTTTEKLYSHFEASMSLENDNGLTAKEIDNARKDCQRLADKAVAQYKVAKTMAANRSNGEYQMKNFEAECKKIQLKSEQDRTMKEIAMLKQYEDEKWQDQFDYRYDYDDDNNYNL